MNRYEANRVTFFDEYRACLDGLKFSERAKDRLVERLAEEPEETGAPKATRAGLASRVKVDPLRRRHRIVAVAACLAIAVGLGGAAYAAANGLVSVPRFAEHLFGGGETNVEVVDRIGHPVGISQSNSGVTVSADAIIGDRTSVAVVFSIANDDGTAFDVESLDNGAFPMGFTDDVNVDFGPLSILRGWGAIGNSYIYDADPNDNALQLVVIRSFAGNGDEDINLIGRTMKVHLADLSYYTDESQNLIAEGPWDLSFPLQYEDTSVELPIGQSFDLGDAVAIIDELDISPFALHLRYTTNQTVEWTSEKSGRLSALDSELADKLLGVRVSLHMSNGSIVEIVGNSSGMITADGDMTHCETDIFFSQIIDLDQVDSVSIGDITIEMP